MSCKMLFAIKIEWIKTKIIHFATPTSSHPIYLSTVLVISRSCCLVFDWRVPSWKSPLLVQQHFHTLIPANWTFFMNCLNSSAFLPSLNVWSQKIFKLAISTDFHLKIMFMQILVEIFFTWRSHSQFVRKRRSI